MQPKGIEQRPPHAPVLRPPADTAINIPDLSARWWGKSPRVLEYLHVATLARKYHAVPESSAASERIFLVGGLVVTKECNRLGECEVFFVHVSIKCNTILVW